MSGTAKQKQVLDETSTARMALAELFADGKADKVKIANLLSAIQRSTKSVKPQEHGVIAKEHLPTRFAAAGADPNTFNYKRLVRDDAGLPTVIEIVFAYCPDAMATRRLITGVNWSVGINNPFRQLGDNGESLDTYLEMQRDFVERKLEHHGIKKVIPDEEELAEAYRLFARSDVVEQIVEGELMATMMP